MVNADDIMQQATSTKDTRSAIDEVLAKLKCVSPEVSALVMKLDDLHAQEISEFLQSACSFMTSPCCPKSSS